MAITEIICLMLVAGIFGGAVNYALARNEKSSWRDFFWSLVIGTGASFLVPLFLNTISSSLLTGILNGTAGKSDVFIFFGFCLLGSIASKAMIQTLTQKVLRETEATRKEVEALKEEVTPIVTKETELEPEDTSDGGIRVQAYGLVGTEPPLIIKSLGSSKYSRRALGGIKKETGISHDKVIEVLEWLEKNGLAISTGTTNRYWSLTKKGREAFRNILNENA